MRRRKRSPPERPRRWRADSPPSAACPTPSRRSITRGRSTSSPQESRRIGLANVFTVGAITKGRQGKELAEIGSMHRRARWHSAMTASAWPMHRSCAKPSNTARCSTPCSCSIAKSRRSPAGRCTPGLVSTVLGLPSIPPEAEQLMIARDLLLNRTIGCRYHVQHISTAWSVELIRQAKRDGQPSPPKCRRIICC